MSPAYSDPRPGSKIGRLRTALMYLMEEHRADGALPTSVRFLFYELVARSIITKSGARPDKIVSEALTDLRERGLVRWTDIVDETRSVADFSGSATVAQDWLAYLSAARLDPWKGKIPFLLTESRSLAGVLRGQVRDYRGRIAPTNGQVAGFLHTDVAPLLRPGDRVGYLGDLDLCGGDIEANTRRVLEKIIGGELNWTRLALTREQKDRYNLPSIIKTDKRFKDGGGRHEAVETEALSQTLIVDIVRDWLDELLPQPLDRVLLSANRSNVPVCAGSSKPMVELAVGKHETGYARVERDFYPTPSWVTEALAEHVELAGMRVWEPACGDGRMSEALKAAGASVYSTDIVDRGYAKLDVVADFLTEEPKVSRFDAIITNPAYGERNKLAEKFIERGLQHIADGGYLALLLPNDFDSAKTRWHLFADCPAFVAKIILIRRIKWFEPPPSERKKSPKENHAWFLWRCKPRLPSPIILYAPNNNGAAS